MKMSAIVMVCALVLSTAAAQDSIGSEVNARDAFWSAADLVDVHPNPANVANPGNQAPKHAKPETSQQIKPNRVAALGYGVAPQPLRTATHLLGLRYTILARDAMGKFGEVLPSAVFRAGDRIRLSVMSNQPGYLYIIGKGTSGEWKPLFPTPGSENHIDAGKVYQFPTREDKSFQFDDRAGTEHVFLLLSRTRVSDMRTLMTNLQSLRGGPQPPESGEATTLVEDTLLNMPTLRSRDLVTTTVDAPPEQPTSEKAVYLINRVSGTDSSAIVAADLALAHH